MVEATGRYLIDDTGEAWPVGSLGLRQRLGSRRRDDDLARYCVTRLGYVHLDLREDRFPAISFARGNVSPIALTALMQWSHDQRAHRFVLYSGGIGKSAAIVANLVQARRLINEAIREATVDEAFAVDAVALPLSPFRAQAAFAAEILVADVSEPLRMAFMEKLFEGSFTLSERRPDTGELAIRAVGTVISRRQFPSFVPGQSFRTAEDRRYGDWVADTLKSLPREMAPRTDMITAPIRLHGALRTRAYKYTRLTLAAEVRSRQMVLTASVAH